MHYLLLALILTGLNLDMSFGSPVVTLRRRATPSLSAAPTAADHILAVTTRSAGGKQQPIYSNLPSKHMSNGSNSRRTREKSIFPSSSPRPSAVCALSAPHVILIYWTTTTGFVASNNRDLASESSTLVLSSSPPTAAPTQAATVLSGNQASIRSRMYTKTKIVVEMKNLEADGCLPLVQESLVDAAPTSSHDEENGASPGSAVGSDRHPETTPALPSFLALPSGFPSMLLVHGQRIPSKNLDSSITKAHSQSQFGTPGQTLTPSVAAPTIGDISINHTPSASDIVETLSPGASTGSSAITTGSSSELVTGSQTLVLGHEAVLISGTFISVAPSTTKIVIGSRTTTLTLGGSLSTITFGVLTTTSNSNTQFNGGSQTLVPGHSAITVLGTSITLAPSASDVVIRTSTERLGSLIMNGFGPPMTSASYPSTTGSLSRNITNFTGSAPAHQMEERRLYVLLFGVWAIMWGY